MLVRSGPCSDLSCSTCSILVIVCKPADTVVKDQQIFWCQFLCILIYSFFFPISISTQCSVTRSLYSSLIPSTFLIITLSLTVHSLIKLHSFIFIIIPSRNFLFIHFFIPHFCIHVTHHNHSSFLLKTLIASI